MLMNFELMNFFVQITIMLFAAVLFGQLAKKAGMPEIVGELIAGIVLGPNILKHFCPDNIYYNGITSEINLFLQFGMVLFMFVSGTKINTAFVLTKRKSIVYTSLLGMIIPLILGVSTVLLLPETINAPPGKDKLIYAFFVGIALSISALPIIIKTLTDLKLSDSEIGNIIISAATIDDIAGWTMFACLINISVLDGAIYLTFISIFKFVVFILVLTTIGAKICSMICNFNEKYVQNKMINFSIIIIMLTLISTIAELIGIHPLFAAFLFGVALRKDFQSKSSLIDTRIAINSFAANMFAPLYFVSIGMKVDFINNINILLIVIILSIAFVGKIAGASTGALLGGANWKDALIIGAGMNSRGAVEIILASTAVELNIIEEQLYVALIIMAVISSILSGPMIDKIFSFSIGKK